MTCPQTFRFLRAAAACAALHLTVHAAAAAATGAAPAPEATLALSPCPPPLIPPTDTWPLGQWWTPGRVGTKDFYFAEQGPYHRLKPESVATLRQVGLLDRFIPGHWNYDINKFAPEVHATLKGVWKEMVDSYLQNRWPVHTIQYCTAKDNPAPSEAAVAALGDLWIGDSMPEAPIYRLEPVFHYLRTGEKWRGSSMGYVDDASIVSFFRDRLVPRLTRELPFHSDPDHQWTREQLRTLCDLYCEEFLRKAGKGIAWGMFLSPYHIAGLPNTTTVAEKGADAFMNARARGVMRQSGGGKFFFTWRGHEPTERYGYFQRGWYSINREEWGYPLPHLWYYIFRPFLIGANYSVIEGVPASLYRDVEGDGQFEHTILGHIARALFDYTDRHPDRGVPYAPVALLMEYTRDWPSIYHSGGTTYSVCQVPYDDADHMNHGILCDVLFPEHRHTRPSGCYSRTAPHGEIFDILSPNAPGRPVDPRMFDGYKVLFALGGQRIGPDYARALTDYVRAGGTLLLNVRDLGEHMPPGFFGVELPGHTLTGEHVLSVDGDASFDEKPFTYSALDLAGAEPLYTCDGHPVVTRHRHGDGYAILVAAHHMVQAQEEESTQGMLRRPWMKKPVLAFVPHLVERLTAGLTPFEVRRREEDMEDLSWLVHRKGDGWLLTLFNYSLRREELVSRPLGTAKVIAEYPYKAVPFEIRCRAPAEDVMECFADRDVNWTRQAGQAVVSETIRGGEIRVYEFQPGRIEPPSVTRAVNLALNRPVTASSTLKGFSAGAAVDGRLNNDDFWQSDLDPKRHYVLDTPQWLQVDLEAPETIDRAFVLFHTWPSQTLETRLRVYKYTVDASLDGETWSTVIDEGMNEDPADAWGLERWFEPVQARHVRLNVLRNSAMAGAQVVELKIMGPEKTTQQATRRSITPAWQVEYPEWVRATPPEKRLHLMDLEPARVSPGWMPAGKTWKQLNGTITLYTDNSGGGGVYAKSLYGESVSEIVYAIPEGAKAFVSAIGLGARNRQASVVFKVLVDGRERYASPLYRFGERVLPVVIDLDGGRELSLVVTDGGDGIAYDYAWWGEAQFIGK